MSHRLINPYAHQASERCLIRKRYLYVLRFKKENTCYIGQTVSPRRRKAEHRQAWRGKKFTMYVLNKVKAPYDTAEDYEYAWRYKAQEQGLEVYGSPKGYFVNSSSRMSPIRFNLAGKFKWPAKLTATATGLGWSLLRLFSRVH